MIIKEVEEILKIPKATIRFYEKEGLIHPRRSSNGYRDYSEADVELLRQIIIFRKLGMSVEMIANLLDRSLTLQEAVDATIVTLEKEMEELNGAISLCRELKKENVEMQSFDGAVWMNRIETKESTGSRFMDLAKDMIGFYGEQIERDMGIRREGETKPVQWKSIFLIISAALVLYCLVVVLVFRESILEALDVVISVSLIEAIIAAPRYFLRKKSREAEKTYWRVITIAAAAVLAFFLLFAVVLLINSRLHMLF